MKLSPEQKLAALAQEVGFERLDSMFKLLKAYNTPKKTKKSTKEQEGFDTGLAKGNALGSVKGN